MWNWYKSMLASRPLWTKACTSCVLMSASDVGCQAMEQSMNKELVATRGTNINLQAGCPTNVNAPLDYSKKNQQVLEYDWNRTMHLGITGFTFSGPISHVWYGVLERLVTTRHYYGGLVLRMILDALLFSPMAMAGAFTWRGVLEGKSLIEIKEKLATKWQQAVVASSSFWPAANAINYGIVPVPFRVLYDNALSVFWNAYLSNVNNRRLEQVVDHRLEHPEDFDADSTGGISKAQQQAHDTVCVCSHCRPIRA